MNRNQVRLLTLITLCVVPLRCGDSSQLPPIMQDRRDETQEQNQKKLQTELTVSKQEFAELLNTVRSIKNATLGMIAYFPTQSPPEGWLIADGSCVAKSLYPQLFTQVKESYGTCDDSSLFRLPDLRGEFIRGLDLNRGIDPGRTIGTQQSHSFQQHSHLIGPVYVLDAAPMPAGGYRPFYYGNGPISRPLDMGSHRIDIETTSTGGAETRPRNLALLPCIHY